MPQGQLDVSLLPYSRFFKQEQLLFYQVAPQLYSRGRVDSVPDLLLLRKSGSAGNGTRTSRSVARICSGLTTKSKSKSKSNYGRRSVDQFVFVSCVFWSRWPVVTFIWATITFLIFHIGLPLWREDGSVICKTMTQVQFHVTLRSTACRPVGIGAGPSMGPITRFLFLCLTVPVLGVGLPHPYPP
jgi:hypothetical protein